MKAETIYYLAPASVRFTAKQMSQIKRAWEANELRQPSDNFELAMEEDVLLEAERLGLVTLPEGWTCK